MVEGGNRLAAARASKADLAIVGVVEGDAIEETRTALNAGVCTGAPRNSNTPAFTGAVHTVLEGMRLLPRETLRSSSERATLEPPYTLSATQRDLLRTLANTHHRFQWCRVVSDSDWVDYQEDQSLWRGGLLQLVDATGEVVAEWQPHLPVFGELLWLLAAIASSRSQTLYERCATPADGSLLA